MSDPIDYWKADDFEDSVAKTIIACFESRLKKNKSVAPSDRIRDKHLNLFRVIGPYVPSSSRDILGNDGDYGCFDINADPLPDVGCLSLDRHCKEGVGGYDGYLFNTLFRKVKSTGKYWHRQDGGQLYVMYILVMMNDGRVTGERRFFTVSSKGVRSCEQRMPSVRGYAPGVVIESLCSDPEIVYETSHNASFALQYVSDMRFSWIITAKEKGVKAHLGCMLEEVKSLLYARDLPLSATGRKRPILHLVAAHKRRMENGSDVDVRSFLRGIQTVTIGGTVFTVRPPLADSVAMPTSQRYFVDGIA